MTTTRKVELFCFTWVIPIIGTTIKILRLPPIEKRK